MAGIACDSFSLHVLQVFHIELAVKSSELVFNPPLTHLEEIVDRLITFIIECGLRVPRVEHVLFPDEERFEMFLPAVELTDQVVVQAKHKAIALVRDNYPGARKYVVLYDVSCLTVYVLFSLNFRYVQDTYTRYYSFLDGSASLDLDNFLKSGEQELTFFGQVQYNYAYAKAKESRISSHPPSSFF